MAETTLSFAERLILANQYRMLMKLEPSQAEDYRQALEIVESGYEFLYETLDPALHTTSVGHDTAQEVCNILDMFGSFENSAKKLGMTAADLKVEFEGLDSDSHHEHYSFAMFMRRKLGRWSELETYPDNSHSSATLTKYRNMLTHWVEIGKPTELNREQLDLMASSAHQRP